MRMPRMTREAILAEWLGVCLQEGRPTLDLIFYSAGSILIAVSNRANDECLKDVADRQRNTVFPDTVQNEGRFWRNIWSGKRSLTIPPVDRHFGIVAVRDRCSENSLALR